MKRLILTTALILTAGTAFAYEPSQGVTARQFVEARGCTYIDMGGYFNVKGPDGGGCAALAQFTVPDSRCIRRWGTTAGLGQLALSGPTASTKLDKAGTVRAPVKSLIHLIDSDPALWPAAVA